MAEQAQEIRIDVDAPEAAEPDSASNRVPAAAPPKAPARRVLGRYELRHTLANGGMASVHLAVARGTAGFQKVFAVKRIHPHLAEDESIVAMFLDEARIASRIDHPHVCAVLDFGEVDGEHFMAMELLLGEPYGKLLARIGKLPAAERAQARTLLVNLLADACEGVHAAHELRSPGGELLHVVHRDISPHNLLVTYNGVIKVLDFGVARVAHQVHETTAGTVKGKFGYMAPEQMRGEPVDRRADVWSLGVVLWESLAGRTLFRRSTQSETVVAVLKGRVPSLADVDPEIGPELDALVARALSVDPDGRYPTARTMGRALRQWVAERGAVMDVADVADWMRRLFPDGIRDKRSLVRRVLQEAPAHAVVEVPVEEVAHPPSHSTVMGRSYPRPSLARRLLPVLIGACALGVGAFVAVGRGAGDRSPVPRPLPVASAPADPPPSAKPVPTAAPQAPSSSVTQPAPPAPAASVALPAPRPAADPPASHPAPAVHSAHAVHVVRRVHHRHAVAPPGHVAIAARGGWANVYLGHRLLGPTPGNYEVPAGKHVLTLKAADGTVSARVPVDVQPDQVSRVAVDLSHH